MAAWSALFDASRPGKAPGLDQQEQKRIIAVVCSPPPEGRARWTVRLLTEEVIKRKLVPRVGRETIRILLESHTSSHGGEKMWRVGELDEEYLFKMEDVLKIYEKPLSEREPVVCVDEKPVVLHEDTRPSIPMRPGQVARPDYEYMRCGTGNVFCGIEPRASVHFAKVTPARASPEFADFILEIAAHYPAADTIHLVMDNLSTHNQTLTPNPDALYFMVFFNTKDGPVVLDLPPGDANGSFNGNIVTVWQMPLEDAGLLGYDKGKGGKYLVLPPGYKDKPPADYIPLQSDTQGGYMLFRANLKSHSDPDVQASINYGKRMKIYPLSAAAHPPETVFSDARDIDLDSTIQYDANFFDYLNNIVQSEPMLDRVMIDQLASLGIERGKPYQPSDQMKSAMNSAAQDARAYLYAKYDAGFPPFFSDTSHWMYPTYPAIVKAQQDSFADHNTYPVDDRGVAYSYAYIGLKRLGTGQMYLISIKDKDGNAFDGSKTYKLTVPPNAPVKQYWSVTAYDRELHTLIKRVIRASRSSQIAELQKNPDGSIDIYCGPKAPDGKNANWVPTDPNRWFELMFRAYAPTEALFQKQWILSDVEIMH